jgi:uncharacterized repeat protein (TIGR03847 family)
MLDNSYDFEEPGLFSVVAVGVPGKRTFFLVIGEKEEWIRLWLEKEQLEAISIAIDQVSVQLSQEHRQFSEEPETKFSSDDLPAGLPSGEFEIDQIGIGFDNQKIVFEFVVHASGPQNLDEIVVNCWINPGKVKMFGKQAAEVCAAGRPRCKLCGQPIDPTTGHDCPMQN